MRLTKKDVCFSREIELWGEGIYPNACKDVVRVEDWGDDEIFDDCIFWKKDGCHVHDPNREPLENPRCIYCEYYEPEGGFE